MLSVGEVAGVLGLRSRRQETWSVTAFMDRIKDGLPVGAVERVARLLAPADVQFKYQIVPKATYERRKKGTRGLTLEEGSKLARVANVWSVALEVWKSDDEARGFLFRPHAMIADRRPIDVVIESEFGADAVADILNGLKYGTAP